MSLLIAEAGEEDFKQALGSFTSGVTVVTFWASEGWPCGMTASSFSSVSVDPLLVLVCVNRDARTYDDVLRQRRFGVNILGRSGVEISSQCARPGEDKYLLDEWLDQDTSSEAPPALVDAIAYLDCTLHSDVPAGTHSIVVGRVRAIGLADGGPVDNPLVYFRGQYRELKTVESIHA
ncbi:MAG: hypothetical protein GEU79_08885 [Acidimicrobiia bacterium]|nr:hypothetical protein [Acidimicrobiia bacterium]